MVRVVFDDRAELLASPATPSTTQPYRFAQGHFLAVHRLAIGSGLWETVSMARAKIEAGQIVVSDGLVGVYRVVAVSPDGQMAEIEKFDVSTQKSLGDPNRGQLLATCRSERIF